jgi:hypothetical protein
MGTTSQILHDIVEGIDDITTFFITVILGTFILGQFYATITQGRHEFWYPVAALLIILGLKAFRDMVRPVTGAVKKEIGGGGKKGD